MLFQKRFHAGIRSGGVRLSFRRWQTPRVAAGRRYRLHLGGEIEVESVTEVPLGRIGDGEARLAGFASAAELTGYLSRAAAARLHSSTPLYRVAFRYLGDSEDPRSALRNDLSAEALADAASQLDAVDRRSRRGPWAWRLLQLIGQLPNTPAARLAEQLERPKAALKADVRRLKGLGLTVSLEAGYELSPLGEAVLARHQV